MRSVYPGAHKQTNTHARVELAGSKEREANSTYICVVLKYVLPTVLPTCRELEQGKGERKDLEQGSQVPSLKRSI